MKPHKRYHKQTNIKISNIGETWNLGTATTDRTNHPKKSITCPEYSSFNDIMNLNPFFPVSWHWISPRLGYTLEAAAGRFMLGLLALLRLLVFPLSFSCFGIFFDFAGTNSSLGIFFNFDSSLGIFFDFAGTNSSLSIFFDFAGLLQINVSVVIFFPLEPKKQRSQKKTNKQTTTTTKKQNNKTKRQKKR